MKRTLLFAALGALLSASAVMALDESELSAKMKDAGKHMGEMRKAMQANDMAAVAEHATGVSQSLRGSGAFWREKKMDDAVQFNRDTNGAAKEIAAAATAGKADEVKAAMAKMGAACKGCHDAHREKVSDGVYKIK